MKTKEIIEGLLFRIYNREQAIQNLKTCHILSKERDWQAIEHPEFYFLDKFLDPYYLIIIDKQIHVYIIGEKSKGKALYILNVEGFNTELWNMSRGDLVEKIKETVKWSNSQYLPNNVYQRILFIDNYKNQSEIYCFNRIAKDDRILKKSKWSIGTNVYSVSNPEYNTSGVDIIKEMLKSVE